MRPRLRSPALNRVSPDSPYRLNGEWYPTGRQVWIGRLQQLRVASVPTTEPAEMPASSWSSALPPVQTIAQGP